MPSLKAPTIGRKPAVEHGVDRPFHGLAARNPPPMPPSATPSERRIERRLSDPRMQHPLPPWVAVISVPSIGFVVFARLKVAAPMKMTGGIHHHRRNFFHIHCPAPSLRVLRGFACGPIAVSDSREGAKSTRIEAQSAANAAFGHALRAPDRAETVRCRDAASSAAVGCRHLRTPCWVPDFSQHPPFACFASSREVPLPGR